MKRSSMLRPALLLALVLAARGAEASIPAAAPELAPRAPAAVETRALVDELVAEQAAAPALEPASAFEPRAAAPPLSVAIASEGKKPHQGSRALSESLHQAVELLKWRMHREMQLRALLEGDGSISLRLFTWDEDSILVERGNELPNQPIVTLSRRHYGSELLSSVEYPGTANRQRFFHLDGLGSVVDVTDETSVLTATYKYDAWGAYRQPEQFGFFVNPPNQNTTSLNRTTYGGHYYDREVDLYMTPSGRMLDSTTGRFLSQDGLEYGDNNRPPSLHRYTWVESRPTVLTDPSGHCPICIPPLIGAIGAELNVIYQEVVEGKSLSQVDAGRAATFGVKSGLAAIPMAKGPQALGAALKYGAGTAGVGATLGGAMNVSEQTLVEGKPLTQVDAQEAFDASLNTAAFGGPLLGALGSARPALNLAGRGAAFGMGALGVQAGLDRFTVAESSGEQTHAALEVALGGLMLRGGSSGIGVRSDGLGSNLGNVKFELPEFAKKSGPGEIEIAEGVTGSPGQLTAGQAWEKAQLESLGKQKNNEVWRPSLRDLASAAFEVIVGKPKFTKGGQPLGTTVDVAEAGGSIEIKGGTKVMESTYQLRLQTYRAVTSGTPLTIQTNRPVNPTFMDYLTRWGVGVEKPPSPPPATP